jgi:hypothetical protein
MAGSAWAPAPAVTEPIAGPASIVNDGALVASASPTVLAGATMSVVAGDASFTISLNDQAALSSTLQNEIVNDLSAAAADWGQHIAGGSTPLRILLTLSNTDNGAELANGGPGALIPRGQTIGGETIFEPNSIYTLQNNGYFASTGDEISITLPADSTALNRLFINPDPFTDPTATEAGKYDLLTVFRHELAHGLGFIGLRDQKGSLGADATLFDTDTQVTSSNGTVTAASFVGSDAEAAYGNLLGTGPTPVPLTILNNGEAYYHLANTASDPLGDDLMSGVGLAPGTSEDISNVDLAILKDVGVPVTAGVICFAHGTRIATPGGEVPVERLAVGDLVQTLSGDVVPTVWIGVGNVLVTRGRRSPATPVIVRKGALADNVPHCDLRVTKGHALYLEGALIPVERLINHRSILWDDRAQEVRIYHIELAGHDVLLANGAPAESYRDDGNRWLFHNMSASSSRLAPEPCAPILTGGALVDAIWLRLLERAGQRPGLPLTAEPDLHLLVDGVRLDPIERCQETYVFRVLNSPRHASIRSRSAIPQELGLARDHRSLGVAVRRLVVVHSKWRCTIKADDARLVEGFHDFEPGDGIRWTDGDATVPPALFDGMPGSAMLWLHLGCAMRYIDEGNPRRVA